MSRPITLIDKPITLFDKSFLQSLGVDESVWFDNFFRANVCPLFYVETLAHLEKQVPAGRDPEHEVLKIAAKFPEMHGTPNAYHARLAIGELLGNPVPMTGQIMLPQGKLVKSGTTVTAIVEPSPEAEAFRRWQDSEFMEIERRYARAWREGLSSLNLNEVAKDLRAQGVDRKTCKEFRDAQSLAEDLFCMSNRLSDFELVLQLVGVPPQWRKSSIKRWKRSGCLPLNRYAPYTAYVVTVDFFFRIALAADLIPTSPPSNFVDIAYLFYLPFCQIFVSSDGLHRNCAPLFLRKDQEFVWGQELKGGLTVLNQIYEGYREEIEKKGVLGFAVCPHDDRNFFVTQLWDRHLPEWRERKEFSKKLTAEDLAHYEWYGKKKMKEALQAPPVRANAVSLEHSNPELMLRRLFRQRKGSWWQAPKDFKPSRA